MPLLSPPTLSTREQRALLRVSASYPRDHLLFSLALGTGLRLPELVDLDVSDVCLNGTPRSRIRLRPEIAKRGRAGDVFLPDALMPKLRRFWRHKQRRGESLELGAPLFCSWPGRRISKRRVQILFRGWQLVAGPALPLPCAAPYSDHQRVSGVAGSLPGAAVREACESDDDGHLYARVGRGALRADSGPGVLVQNRSGLAVYPPRRLQHPAPRTPCFRA
jgi:hypothetical protein